jgi:xanthine dehydrogenase small subunit
MRDCVTFILNGRVETVGGIDPTTTLLEYLRLAKALTGTKEGCAEGDCGACTVVVGGLEESKVAYRAIDACIAFLPQIEGKLVITVEGVAGPDRALHPCQQALVDHHGSQCGFCTPGFVMSLYAGHLNGRPTGDRDANALLAGNLCRCTGYGPIVTAARGLAALPRPGFDIERRKADRALLEGIAHTHTVQLEADGRVFYAPASEDELFRLLDRHPEATIVAGATDLGLLVTKQKRSFETLISVGRIANVSVIAKDSQSIRLGAGVTIARAAQVLGERWPSLGRMLRRFAGEQIRNAGTIGGNIANGSPIGDMAPALIALGAKLQLRKGGATRSLALEDFFLAYGRQDRQPGEVVTHVEIPLAARADELSCHKVSKRFDDDISAVCGGFNITVADGRVRNARIAFGGMAGVPRRALAAERALIGEDWNRETLARAAKALEDDFAPIDDLRASAAYRMEVAKGLLLRCYLERAEPGSANRLAGIATALGG